MINLYDGDIEFMKNIDVRVFSLTAIRLKQEASFFHEDELKKTIEILGENNKTLDDFEGLTFKEGAALFESFKKLEGES